MAHENNTILIVDDEPVSLIMLRTFLASGGYNVHEAASGLDAFEKAKERPDLILLDILMPGMDGFETCRRLKENEVTRDIPVLFLSARQDSKARVNGLTLGGVDFISKPFDGPELLARVKTHLTLRRQELQLSNYAKKLEQMVEERTKQLIHADRLAALGTFSAAVAHEINNPLMFIGMNLDFLELLYAQLMPLMERCTGGDEKGELRDLRQKMDKHHKGIAEGIYRISSIVNTLKDYSRKGSSEKAPCPVLDPINDALRLLAHRLKYRHSVELSVPDDTWLFCDHRKISQVFVNLMNNALDAMDGRDGRIRIEAETAADRIHIRFKDSGPGIPDALSENVFDPFFTTKGEAQGTGLGLFIVKSIVEEHQGTIHLRAFDGTGAEFHIELPLKDAPLNHPHGPAN